MSNHVSSLVRSRNLGVGLTGKSIILLMAEFASDDGTGIWAAKATMARELETSERTIQRTIKALIDAGLVAEVGRKKHRNGETYEYEISLSKVAEAPLSKPEPPTHRRPSTQDVDETAQDMTPDTLSPPTEGRPTPDTPSPHAPTHRRPNQIEPQREPKVPPKSPIDTLCQIVRRETAEDFAAHRKAMRKPLTEVAAVRLVKKLANHPNPDAVFDLSIENGWQGVFPEKIKGGPNERFGNHPAERRPDPALEQIARLAGLEETSGHGGA